MAQAPGLANLGLSAALPRAACCKLVRLPPDTLSKQHASGTFMNWPEHVCRQQFMAEERNRRSTGGMNPMRRTIGTRERNSAEPVSLHGHAGDIVSTDLDWRREYGVRISYSTGEQKSICTTARLLICVVRGNKNKVTPCITCLCGLWISTMYSSSLHTIPQPAPNLYPLSHATQR